MGYIEYELNKPLMNVLVDRSLLKPEIPYTVSVNKEKLTELALDIGIPETHICKRNLVVKEKVFLGTSWTTPRTVYIATNKPWQEYEVAANIMEKLVDGEYDAEFWSSYIFRNDLSLNDIEEAKMNPRFKSRLIKESNQHHLELANSELREAVLHEVFHLAQPFRDRKAYIKGKLIKSIPSVVALPPSLWGWYHTIELVQGQINTENVIAPVSLVALYSMAFISSLFISPLEDEAYYFGSENKDNPRWADLISFSPKEK